MTMPGGTRPNRAYLRNIYLDIRISNESSNYWDLLAEKWQVGAKGATTSRVHIKTPTKPLILVTLAPTGK